MARRNPPNDLSRKTPPKRSRRSRVCARGSLNVMDKALIEFQKACGPNDTRETQLHLDIQFLIDQYAEENKRGPQCESQLPWKIAGHGGKPQSLAIKCPSSQSISITTKSTADTSSCASSPMESGLLGLGFRRAFGWLTEKLTKLASFWKTKSGLLKLTERE